MGGRGASSGRSAKGNRYGSQYRTVFKIGNIKFVEARNGKNSESLLETMTRGRVYVRVAGNDLKQIIYFDKKNHRTKTIDLDHQHKGMQDHVHHGYFHTENKKSKKLATHPDTFENRTIDNVRKLWDNYLNNR